MGTPEVSEGPKLIKALTVEQVDWSLFHDSSLARERLERRFPAIFDFHIEAYEAIRKRKGKKHANYPEIKKSDELKFFLQTNRPHTLFFEPQDIANLLTPESNIACDRKKTDRSEIWQFTLNPKKHNVSNGLSGPDRKQTITLSRSTTENKAGVGVEPYLVIGFAGRYKDKKVIFTPEVRITYGDSIPRDNIEEEMIRLLGLRPKTVEQELDFKVEKERWTAWKTKNGLFGRIVRKATRGNAYPVKISLKKTS